MEVQADRNLLDQAIKSKIEELDYNKEKNGDLTRENNDLRHKVLQNNYFNEDLQKLKNRNNDLLNENAELRRRATQNNIMQEDFEKL